MLKLASNTFDEISPDEFFGAKLRNINIFSQNDIEAEYKGKSVSRSSISGFDSSSKNDDPGDSGNEDGHDKGDDSENDEGVSEESYDEFQSDVDCELDRVDNESSMEVSERLGYFIY